MHRLHPLVVPGILALGAPLALRTQPASELIGRWAGESACMGAHPACHDEHVVYRIDAAGAGGLTIQGSRVAGADTVDMGPLACRTSAGRTARRAEATCHVPAGVWTFWIAQGRLEGSLTLTDHTVARHVVAHRLTSQ